MNPMSQPPLISPLAWLIDLEYMSGWKALLIFALLAAPIILLGLRSLAGLGPLRKWVAISVRLFLLLVLVLLIGGARWNRQHKSLDVMVLRDTSISTWNYPFSGRSLTELTDDLLLKASLPDRKGHPDDRIGVASFDRTTFIEAMPNRQLILDARAIRDAGNGTDIAGAIRTALAAFQRDAMKRIVLISDGNQTAGDLDGALTAAAAQGVPIDVIKLSYNVRNEIMIDRVVAPNWKREGEAFDVKVYLVSTNTEPVTGKLTVYEDNQPLERPRQITVPPATMTPSGKIEPRKHMEQVQVPAVKATTVRSFKATFTPDVVNPRGAGAAVAGTGAAAPGAVAASPQLRPGDTQLDNNSGTAFTMVQGEGKVLYIDASRGGGGLTLMRLLEAQRINVDRKIPDQAPSDPLMLQGYDAVILNNVPLGRGPEGGDGLSIQQDVALAQYVHDFGGGLIMLGGPSSFGAGGWQGSKVADVMPVDMDIPAQRQMPKGALVLVIHSCEMPQGNYWGEQCAIKAIETLSARDDVGVIAYDWGGGNRGGIGGANWVYPLAQKGDGSRVIGAVKKMNVGDMPSFDDAIQLAVHGAGPGQVSLATNDAANKHIIIVSDGDPAVPQPKLMKALKDNKISVSCIAVYPHQPGVVPPGMQQIAKETGGRYYGPIEANPNQLPQIFIKEATVVRRTLIQEAKNPPIGVRLIPNTGSEVVKNVFVNNLAPPPIFGMVLTSPKLNPTIDMPLKTVLGGGDKGEVKEDPLLAHWQAGLGKTAAFTSDASTTWMQPWFNDEARQKAYGKMFTQMVKVVSRPPMSRDFTLTTERNGDRMRIRVEATNTEGGFTSALSINGKVMDPAGNQQDVRLVQSGPGEYIADVPVGDEGNYVVGLSYTGAPKNPGDKPVSGWLAGGLAINDSPETRELRSNDQVLHQIAERTGGNVYSSFDPVALNLFSRQNIKRGSSPLPVWDILLPLLLALVILDVAIRRIAWDYASLKKMALAASAYVRTFTTTRHVEAKPTLDALKRVRGEVAESRFKTGDGAAPAPPPVTASTNRSAKFEATTAVEGDITSVVGGATNKAIPAAPKDPKPKGAPAGPAGGHTGSLLEAKRRAQQQIKQKEQGE